MGSPGPTEDFSGVRWIAEHIPFYRVIYGAEGIDPRTITSYGEFSRLPTLRKGLLRSVNPDLLHPPGAVHEITFESSGTTGRPLVTKYTLEDYMRSITKLAALREREDFRGKKVLMLLRKGHSAEFGTRKGFELLEAERIDLAPSFKPEEVLRGIEEHRYNVLVGIPENPKFPGTSLLDLLGADKEGVVGSHVELAICVGGELREEARTQMAAAGLDVVSSYGSTETAGIATEKRGCKRQHVYSDSLVEVLRDGKPAGPGERGSIVVSTLARRGSTTYVRLLTGDSAVYHPPPCRCGEDMATLEGVKREEEQDLYLESGCRVMV